MYVVATAGHVDHGKSTLVRALTEMEPDRWAEEHRRGMTIDLGFAWTALPSGGTLAFVDVPGHQRFIGNMLAGLGPAPAVLFVVAADEGWRAQSAEHLAAIDALGLRHGLLAVTRADLTDPTAATEAARAQLRATSLGEVEAVAVSGRTGQGLDRLRAALDRLVDTLPTPDPAAPGRLWIDRAFTIRGAGTVVTGTLEAGTLTVGDELIVRGRRVAVRGLQTLGRTEQTVAPPARVAVNLRGVSVDDVARGDVLTTAGVWTTRSVDVRLSRPADKLPSELMLHVGSAALPVHVRPFDPMTVRLTLPTPQPVRAGDRAILRDPGAQSIVGGVLVLDADPPTLRRRGAATARAAELRSATGVPDLQTEVGRRGAVRRDHLRALGVALTDDATAIDGWLVDPARWAEWTTELTSLLDRHAATSPLQQGIPLETVRRELQVPDGALTLALLAAAGATYAEGRVRSAAADDGLGPTEQPVRALEERLRADPFAAPERPDLLALGLGRRELAAAERAGRLLRLADDVVVLPDAPDRAVRHLAALPQPFTTSQARQSLGTTRRVVIPVLEHLDARGRTRRLDGTLREVVR